MYNHILVFSYAMFTDDGILMLAISNLVHGMRVNMCIQIYSVMQIMDYISLPLWVVWFFAEQIDLNENI